MTVRPWILALALAASAGCRDAFTANVDVVARAGPWELTVDRLGEIFAGSKALVPRRDIVERMAQLWVDYSLYAQRAVAGDSMLDSAEVLAVVWPEVQQRRIDHFHDALVESAVRIDSAQVDSIYGAGELRLLRHVLFRIESAMSPPARTAQRRAADATLGRLRAGGSWVEANKMNQDTRTQQNNGSLGVVARGDLVGVIDSVGFVLEAGALSRVVESPLGYHIMSRPRLRDAREEFRLGVEDRMVAQLDTAYLGSIATRRHFKIRGDAAAAARAAIADPMNAGDSRTVLGTFDGGTFRVRDLVRWLRALPSELQNRVSNADDAQLAQFLRQLMRNEAMMVEADSVGAKLTAPDIAEFTDMLRRDLAQLSAGLGIDAKGLPDSVHARPERMRMAAVKIDQYLEGVAANRATFVAIPPFLASRLREQGNWRVVSAGIDRVLARAEALKAALDSARAAMPAPGPAPATDSGGTK